MPPVRDVTAKAAKPLLLVLLALSAAGCGGDEALQWHYWIAPVIMLSVVFIVLVVLPLGYYMKVWRLKHRGR
jgi:hypothetical protein